MKVTRLITAILITAHAMMVQAQTVIRCENLFNSDPIYDSALEVALTKVSAKLNRSGLSEKDIEFLVEDVLKKNEGPRHALSDYWQKSSTQRTQFILARHLTEKIIQDGLIAYFEEQGLLIDHSRLMTKIEIINRSKSFNVLSALWGGFTLFKGTPPIFLPEASFKIENSDFNTLLLNGLNSNAAKPLIEKYRIKMEVNRGYELFSRYYTRVVLAMLIFIVYDYADEQFEKSATQNETTSFDDLVKALEKHFDNNAKILSPEDILFETVVDNFKKKYARVPNDREMTLICTKVYGQGGCK